MLLGAAPAERDIRAATSCATRGKAVTVSGNAANSPLTKTDFILYTIERTMKKCVVDKKGTLKEHRKYIVQGKNLPNLELTT